MYRFNPYWTDEMRISFLQRVILIHSYLYYERDCSVWSDKKYDEVAKQLALLLEPYTKQWIKNKTQYGYAFYDFDGSTGFYLFHRLDRKDRKQIAGIAESIRR